jgi:hypothetical protein
VASSVLGGFHTPAKGGALMPTKLFVSLILAGLICAYVAMMYALMYQLALIDNSYLQNLAM